MITCEDGTVHFYEDGHYWTEIAGIPPEDQIPSYEHSYVLNPEYKKRVIRVRFSVDPIRGIHPFSLLPLPPLPPLPPLLSLSISNISMNEPTD